MGGTDWESRMAKYTHLSVLYLNPIESRFRHMTIKFRALMSCLSFWGVRRSPFKPFAVGSSSPQPTTFFIE